ncbi:MAG: LacI family transcriptional regulator [Treponemataceae bacterium]|nr:LacI family transcriptional regulator [Treponemataceae bacterium]
MSNRLRSSDKQSISKSVTLKDIADELGLSKTTVSRVLSGTGRISEETKNRVLECVKSYDYKPNLVAKGLATSKSFNIGVLLPGDDEQSDIPFFHKCLSGITQEAALHGYDALVMVSSGNSAEHLERVLRQNKADGIVITRLMEDDSRLKLLQNSALPFVVIGSGTADGIVQVDTDHENACCEFTELLIEKGFHKFLFLYGPEEITVNRFRKNGFLKALKKCGIEEASFRMSGNNRLLSDVEKSLMENVSFLPDCIICGDDVLCSYTLNWLDKAEIQVPEELMVASFYNSNLLDRFTKVPAVDVDADMEGRTSVSVLMSMLKGERVEEKTRVDYSFIRTENL